MKDIFQVAVQIGIALSIFAFFCAGALLLFTSWKMPIHQYNLWKLEQNFQQIAPLHPRESQLLSHMKEFGNLFRGASNGCDYFVGEFRSATLPQRDIVEAYGGLFVNPFDRTERVPVEVYFLDNEEAFSRYPWDEWRENIRASFKKIDPFNSAYVVFVAQTNYPPDGDIRCH